MKNKILILSSVLFFGIAISYIAFGWSEPTSSMPSQYSTPINTSVEAQDVSEGKPVVANLNADKLDGYEASDLLALVGGSQPAEFVVTEGTSCPAQTILIATYYGPKTCTWTDVKCSSSGVSPNIECKTTFTDSSCTTSAGWFQNVPTCNMMKVWIPCSGGGGTSSCSGSGSVKNETCSGVVTYVLCLTIDAPE